MFNRLFILPILISFPLWISPSIIRDLLVLLLMLLNVGMCMIRFSLGAGQLRQQALSSVNPSSAIAAHLDPRFLSNV